MPPWNARPSKFNDALRPVVTQNYAVKQTGTALLLGLLVLIISLFRPTWLLVIAPAYAYELVVSYGVLLGGVCVLTAAAAALRWYYGLGTQAARASLNAKQRKLLGLPPPAPKMEPPKQRAAFVAQKTPQATPTVTPQRGVRPLVSASTPPGGPASGLDMTYAPHPTARTPSSAGRSPYSNATPGGLVLTPDSLQPFLDALAHRPLTPSAPPGTPGFADASLYGDYGGGNGSYDLPTTSPGLPRGADAPKYHMSWLPRKSQPAAAGDGLTTSTEEEIEEVLNNVLQIRRASLDAGTDNLREWFSARVLRPLATLVQTAHEAPNALLAALGQPSTLPQLPDLLDADTAGNGSGSSGYGSSIPPSGSGAGSGSSAGTSSAGVGDVEALVGQAGRWATAAVAGLPPTSPQAGAFQQLVVALNRYASLLALLRGKRPADVLPPCPPGYVWRCIMRLSRSTALADFNWGGGGDWAGRAWSADLPTDTGLLLYLFGAFMENPGWVFRGSGGEADLGASLGRPLYLGSVRPRPPAQYSVILSYRPDRPGPGVDGLLGLALASTNPVVCALLEGRTLALSGPQALFYAILMFLHYHKVALEGFVGPNQLSDDAIRLDKVIATLTPSDEAVVHQHIFGSWFPPVLTPRLNRGLAMRA